MSGIYIHIPYCKQACHYCDFHFSTSLKYKSEMLTALCKEITLRRGEFETEIVKSIYFGGGTPSILSTNEINLLIQSVFDNYNIHESVEITLEANPDDLSDEKKMSKSLGNILDPIEVIKDYGIDQLRYYLIKEVSLGNDGSISMENLKKALEKISSFCKSLS